VPERKRSGGAGFAGAGAGMSGLRNLEPLARRVWPPFFLCLLVVVTWALVDGFGGIVYTDTTLRMFITLMLVLGLQIFSGNSGVLSFGHIAFMAVGAYTSALLTIPTDTKKFTFLTMPHFLKSWIFPAHLSALEGTLAGAGFATVFALITAPPIVRLAGVQAGIGTLAILVIVYVFDVQTSSITRGTSTMIGVPQTTTFVMVLIWTLIFILVAFAFQQSGRGLRLRATRENERAAKSVAVGVATERAVAWVLSGFVVGAAGALYGHYIVTFSPDQFYFDTTFLTIAMLVVGGMTSVTGAVVGCYLLTIVNEVFRRWEVNGLAGVTPPSGTANLVLAGVLLVTLILRPKGLTGGKEVPWPGDWSFRGIRSPWQAIRSAASSGGGGGESVQDQPARTSE
jgi:branched-chain amino acid transport system permease protein